MFDIPTLGDAPDAVHTADGMPAFERLARDLARNGFMHHEDLRIGGGGLRCLVEKPFRRWWRERNLPQYLPWLPLGFAVIDGACWDDCPAGGRRHAWLVVQNHAAPTRCYLAPGIGTLVERFPEFAQHVMAVLYAGLDALCHSVRPPELLAFARAYWWAGGEDKPSRGDAVMSRRKFDNRVAPIAQAPHAWPPIVYHFVHGNRNLVEAVREVHELSAGRLILRPNAEAITSRLPGQLGAIVRWRHGDPALQLLDHHWHRGHNRRFADFHGAWPIPGDRAALEALLARVEATVRLMEAVDRLIDLATHPARRMPFYI